MKEHIFYNAKIVTGTEVLEGHIQVKNGVIKDIATGKNGFNNAQNTVDCEGDYLIPGLIELHTDNLEKHLMPRPSVLWPNPVNAFLTHDAQIAAAGITTVYDSICIGDTNGSNRYTMLGLGMDAFHSCVEECERDLRSDHRLHIRCELGDPELWNLFEPAAKSDYLGLVSLMDHTPGQRQWQDYNAYRTYQSKNHVWSDEEFAKNVEHLQQRQEKFAKKHTDLVVDYCKENQLPLASHDDTTIEHVEEAVERGINICEFPTTLESAKAAFDKGLTVLMGSPNVVRGGSHSGNIGAMEVAKAGYLGGLSSDYVPSSLLQGAFLLHQKADMDLASAISTVTSKNAKAVGLNDRGEIKKGLRADMVRVHMRKDSPLVREVWLKGSRVF